ncbi:MAG: endonuclease III domain-containing protein [Verrucomicrobiota bacterium]
MTTDIDIIYRLLKREYNTRNAPIVGFQKIRGREPFRVLVGAILSSRTRDETTGPVTKRFFTKIKKPDDIRRYSTEQLEKFIYPVGFYRTKAKRLKKLPEAMQKFDGKVPDTLEDLCSLPGVGRKVANLILAEVFDKDAICVDIHVHRISNRLGLVKTKTPEQTEKVLKEVLPRRYWKTWNPILVSHGQTICTPQRPDCPDCPVEKQCKKTGVMDKCT